MNRNVNEKSSSSEIVSFVRPVENSIETDDSIDTAYLKSTIEKDFPNWLEICNDTHQMKRFWTLVGEFLRKYSDAFENRTGNMNSVLKKLLPVFNDKYKDLEKLVAKWRPNRENVIQNLSDHIDKLDRNFKWFSYARFFSSSADIVGTVTGLMYRSETDLAGYAFNMASFCGAFGFLSSIIEIDQSKRILDEVSEAIEKDHELLSSVIEWFKETEKLDLVVQELFPHGIDKKIVQEIQASSADLEDSLKIFKATLRSNVQRDASLYQNPDFLYRIQLFACSDVAPLWWNRIIYRKHPFDVDLGRVALQAEFGQMQSIIFQSIPALPLEQQRLTSLPVAGRLMLNFLTLYDSFTNLSKGAKSRHSDKLRKQLSHLESELKNINDTVKNMDRHG